MDLPPPRIRGFRLGPCNTSEWRCVERSERALYPGHFDITSVIALLLLSSNGTDRAGATRLFLIAASECAFRLWKLEMQKTPQQQRWNPP